MKEKINSIAESIEAAQKGLEELKCSKAKVDAEQLKEILETAEDKLQFEEITSFKRYEKRYGKIKYDSVNNYDLKGIRLAKKETKRETGWPTLEVWEKELWFLDCGEFYEATTDLIQNIEEDGKIEEITYIRRFINIAEIFYATNNDKDRDFIRDYIVRKWSINDIIKGIAAGLGSKLEEIKAELEELND